MPDEIAFLRTILEQPDDDAPRLVFADWLEEHGETPRAEFIRVQVELFRLPKNSPRRLELSARERELLDRHQRGWIAALGDWVREWDFARGLLEYVRVQAVDFIRHGHLLFEKAAVRKVRLNEATRFLADVAESPVLHHLRWLDLSYNGITADRLSPLLESHSLASLEYLDIGMNRLGQEGLAALAASKRLDKLQALRLHRIGLRDSGAVHLLSTNWQSLRELDLENNNLGATGISALVDAPFAPNLRRLILRANRIAGAGVRALVTPARLIHLTFLDLSLNQIDDDGAVAIANSATLSALEELNLSANLIGRRGARALAASRRLADLRRLNLSGNRLSREEIKELKHRFGERVQCSMAPQMV